jgi:acetyltransferase-like isoleucine patch superfamily enzyme
MKFNNRNVHISASATIGKNVRIGDNTTIYDNVVIDDNVTICNDCVIGEPTSAYYQNAESYVNKPTHIGAGSFVRSHCIIYAGTELGEGCITGHRVTIRENTIAGKHCLISTLVDIQGNCKIGDYSRIYSNVHIGEQTVIGNYVFIYPYTIFTNDPQPPSTTLSGAHVDDYSIITIHCKVLPGVKVGKHCLVGANSVISRDIEEYSFAMGAPAKRIKDIREIPSKMNNAESYYPWPYHFERGMPWQGIGYDKWIEDGGVGDNG